ncbi:MAG TPA: Fe-S cluster assembly protein SufD [Kiritimatiellia bacterium]|nr:Fe-S cluster assembly protein SufD [Kiritimatiellia bacterium]
MKTRSVGLGEGYAALFNAQRGGVLDPPWLAGRRDDAFARLQQSGLPTRHVEEWKYTDISFLAGQTPAAPVGDAVAVDPARLPMWHEDDLNIVLVDGRLQQELSPALESGLLEWARLGDLGKNPETTPVAAHPAALLHAAFVHDGVLVRIPANAQLARRVHILLLHASLTPHALLAPWVAIFAGANSQARVVITAYSLSDAACLHLPRVMVSADSESNLAISQAQLLNTQSWQLATSRVELQRDAHVAHLEAGLGAALARHDLTAVLLESGARVELNGLYALDGKRHADFHTLIEHRQPNCSSRQVYKGILAGKAAGVFNGAVRVFPGASGTDGYQLNKALLMSREAQMFSKPELLIDNDDVKCSHGATIGQINPQELFYLQSRGIPEAQARHMLARGFVEDIMFQQGDDRLRADLDGALDRYFAAHE